MSGVANALLFLKLKVRRVLFVTLVILLFFNKGGVPRLVGKLNGKIGDFGRKVGKIRSSVSKGSGGKRAGR